MKQKPVVFAGSFDPVTNGHLDIIRRARAIFGAIVVLVADNAQKKTLFTVSERVELLKNVLSKEKNVQVDSTKGLLVNYLKKKGLKVLVRGVRGAEDIPHEMTNAHYNNYFYPKAETVFLPCPPQSAFISSSAVKEAFFYGADISGLVPEQVVKALKSK
jgi:pantetheine-phosphate adenylyltransferase